MAEQEDEKRSTLLSGGVELTRDGTELREARLIIRHDSLQLHDELLIAPR
jgi:hypothetical protein